MPEIAAQPQFWPKSITITRDADNLVLVVNHKDIHYDQKNGILTISFGEESNAIITEAIENISPFAPWTFAMEFQSGREHIHGSEFNVIKVTALICKNGKPCGHVVYVCLYFDVDENIGRRFHLLPYRWVSGIALKFFFFFYVLKYVADCFMTRIRLRLFLEYSLLFLCCRIQRRWRFSNAF